MGDLIYLDDRRPKPVKVKRGPRRRDPLEWVKVEGRWCRCSYIAKWGTQSLHDQIAAAKDTADIKPESVSNQTELSMCPVNRRESCNLSVCIATARNLWSHLSESNGRPTVYETITHASGLVPNAIDHERIHGFEGMEDV
jgi:hypothetical protein